MEAAASIIVTCLITNNMVRDMICPTGEIHAHLMDIFGEQNHSLLILLHQDFTNIVRWFMLSELIFGSDFTSNLIYC